MKEQMPIQNPEPRLVQVRTELTTKPETSYAGIRTMDQNAELNPQGQGGEAPKDQNAQAEQAAREQQDAQRQKEEQKKSQEARELQKQIEQTQRRSTFQERREKAIREVEKEIGEKFGEIEKSEEKSKEILKSLERKGRELGLEDEGLEEFKREGEKKLELRRQQKKYGLGERPVSEDELKANIAHLAKITGRAPDQITEEEKEHVRQMIARGEAGQVPPEPPENQPPEMINPDDPFFSNTRAKDIARRWAGDPDKDNLDYIRRRRPDLQKFMDENPEIPGEQIVRVLQNMHDREEYLRRQADAQQEEAQTQMQGISPERFFTAKRISKIIDEPKYRDEIFNLIFAVADSKPHVRFGEAFDQLYNEPIYKAFMKILEDGASEQRSKAREKRNRGEDATQEENKAEELHRAATRYGAERQIKEVLHDANYAISQPSVNTEGFVGFLQQFKSELADVAFDIKGVPVMIHMYEQALMKIMADNNGYLPYTEVVGDLEEGVSGRAEILAKEYFRDAVKDRLVKYRTWEKNPQTGKLERNWATVSENELEDWEINRAFSVARGMSIVMLRTVEIASLSKLPKGGELVSLYALDLVRDMAPFRHIIAKFNSGLERLAVLGYLLEKKSVWTRKELNDFVKAMEKKKMVDVLDGKIGGDRYIGNLNPFKIGSIFSRSTWRAGVGDEDQQAPESAVKDFISGPGSNPDNRNWIGTGVRLEQLRGDIEHNDPGAKERAENLLRRIAQVQPMKFYLHDEDIRRHVLDVIGREFGLNPENPQDKERIDEIERDVILIQERLLQKRKVLIDNGKTFETVSFDDVFDESDSEEKRASVRRFRDAVLEKVDDTFIKRFLERGDQDWPFIFGTEDIPYEEYHFASLGGSAIARRARDFGGEAKAAEATKELIAHMDSFHSPEEIAKALREIYNHVKSYDENRAREVAYELSQGVINFYRVFWYAKLPVVGRILGIMGKDSFATSRYGKQAMSWDEIDVHEFTRVIQSVGLINKEQMKRLRGRSGATWEKIVYAIVRQGLPLIAIALALYFISRLLKEERR
ncbi:MAG: hypothetical protein M1450_05230 [Patescibacteria group bacterium]|nr:hypothetical protein [Patescibacteria group bacterium]